MGPTGFHKQAENLVTWRQEVAKQITVILMHIWIFMRAQNLKKRLSPQIFLNRLSPQTQAG